MNVPEELKTAFWVTIAIIVVFMIYFLVKEAFMPMEAVKSALESIKQT